MRKRVLVAEPDPDVRTLLEHAVRRAGHDAVAHAGRDDVDAIVMEPGCAVARSLLDGFDGDVPPVVCVSIYPPESGLAPPETVAYVLKPSTPARVARVLADVLEA
ncbi:MAG TPA: hypothetical protein VFL60_01660 [Gaiellaceae bacterium]|nr:hypothetical protein [Gaiellaceae bacterium]